MANLTITLDDEDKKSIAEFCDQVGMTISGLYNVFTKQVLREGRIPFHISVDRPNEETIAALLEGERLAYDTSVKGYTSAEELFAALDKELSEDDE